MVLFRLKWVRRVLVLLGLPIVFGFVFFQFTYPTCTFRYKLTAEVMTPDGLKTGSSVIEVSYSARKAFFVSEGGRQDKVTGEAVYVDLGRGKNLFILLGTDKWERKASYTPGLRSSIDGIPGGEDARDEQNLAEGSLNVLWLPIQVYSLGRIPHQELEIQNRVNSLRGQAPADVDFKNLPLLGTFEDTAKPETFSALQPTGIAAVLGVGYELKSVRMQIVNEPINQKVKSTLPWLETLQSGLIERSNSGQVDIRTSIGQRYFWAKSGSNEI